MFPGMGPPLPLWATCSRCCTTLVVKNFFLISSVNLPSFSLKPLLLVLLQQTLLKTFPVFPVGSLQAPKGCYKLSPQPSLLQAEQPQLSHPFLIKEVFRPSDHLCGPPPDLLQQLHVLLVLRAPELDAGLQVGSHQSQGEGQNHLL